MEKELMVNTEKSLSTKDVQMQVKQIQELYREVMQENQHFGVVPGCGAKRVLLKPGAEKLCMTFRLDPQYDSKEVYDGEHLTVKTKCTLYHIDSGKRLGSGEGMCSTKESKYAYRKGARKCPECGQESIIKGKKDFGGGWLCYQKKGGCGLKWTDASDQGATFQTVNIDKVANDCLADQYNTVLKMSDKRALVASVLNVTAASDIFTQDLEDNEPNAVVLPEAKKEPEKKEEPKQEKIIAIPTGVTKLVTNDGDVYSILFGDKRITTKDVSFAEKAKSASNDEYKIEVVYVFNGKTNEVVSLNENITYSSPADIINTEVK